jgi:hypothetical protein
VARYSLPFSPAAGGLRGLLAACLGLALVSGCLDGETRIIGGGRTDAAAGGGAGDGGGTGGGGAVGPFPDHACALDVEAEDLSGFEGDATRWSAAGGRIRSAPDDEVGRDRSLLLRGPDETCSDFVASVEFVHVPGTFPMLLGRVADDGRWFGIGYDATYGNFTATNGLGTELRDRIGALDPVDLTPGALYRMELRVVDTAVLGLLYDEASDRPLAMVEGPGADIPGAGRLGLYDPAGGSAVFGALRAGPIERPGEAAPRLESARLIEPHTVLVTLSPRQLVPVTAPDATGFTLSTGGRNLDVESVRLRPGSRSELLVRTVEPLFGADVPTLSYDAAAGRVRDASQQPLARIDAAPVDNLLHVDAKFDPLVDNFDGDGLADAWRVVQPEAFTVGGGAVRISATDAFATGAMLLRPTAERHANAEILADFRWDPAPDRGIGTTEVVVALRARSHQQAQYQAALRTRADGASLVLRFMSGGEPTELAVVPVPREAVAPGVPLRLAFSVVGPLLSARIGAVDGPLLAQAAARDERLHGAGPAGLTGMWDGTVRFDRVEIREASPPAPFIAEARVRAESPERVDLTVLAASALQAVSPDGFTVWAGDRRSITRAETTTEGLALTLSAPVVQAGQRVLVSYDPSRGTVTDSARPPQPLAALDRLEARNEANAGRTLAVATSRLVTPHTLDVVTTDTASLPLRVDGPAARSFSVTANGRPAPVVTAYALGAPHGNVVRLTLEPDLIATDVVSVAYTAGGAGRVLDGNGTELVGFLDAPVSWEVPAWPPAAPFSDTFERPDVAAGLGNGWRPATDALWSVRDGVAVFQSAGVETLDPRVVRPEPLPARYALSARIWSSAFEPGRAQPVALLFGSLVRIDPRRPAAIQVGFDFAGQVLFVQGPDGATTYAARLADDRAVGPGTQVVLRLSVHGQAVEGTLDDAEGEPLARVVQYLTAEPPVGEVGFAGSAGARVLYFDDFAVENPEGTAPNMLVTDARVTPDSPNAVLLLMQTAQGASGELVTAGGPGGFTVAVDGGRRDVLRTEAVGSGLRVQFGGPPVSQRQAVSVGYDDRQGDVHDASLPVARPLDAFTPQVVSNGADVGADLFIESAETVGPWAVDLVMNQRAAAPIQAEADALDAVAVYADGLPVPVREVATLFGRPHRLRLVLGAALSPEAVVDAAYTPGVQGARILDGGGRELQPGYEVHVANRVEADADFAPLSETFDGVGAGIVNGWQASPARDWSRNAGDAVLTSEDEGVEGTLLRPAAEAQVHAEVETVVRLNPPGFGTIAFGIAGRVGPGQGYRFVLEPESATRTGLFLVETDGTGVRVLDRTSLPMLTGARDYRLVARFHGPVIQAQLTEAGADAPVLARLLVVDETPLGPGQFGVLGRTRGQVRFREVDVRPATGYPARVVGIGARAFTYDPRTISLAVAAPAPLLMADGRGFSVTVDGRDRPVRRVTARRSALDLLIDGAPLEPGQAIRLSYDPTVGYVYDDSAVPQPLGGLTDLPVTVVEAAVLSSTAQVGENILALDFALSAAQGGLTVEGEGGIDVDVEAPQFGPDPVRFGVDEVWVDPASDGTRLFLATTDDLPDDGQVRLSTDQRVGARVVDALGTPLADFGVDAVGPAAEAEVGAAYPMTWTFDWDAPSGWATYGSEAGWVEMPGLLVARGSRVFDGVTQAFAPVERAGRDLRVSVDFTIQPDTTPFGRLATPGVLVRGYNDGTYLLCQLRTDLGRVPARDENGDIAIPAARIDPQGPALVCARRLDSGPPAPFEACRMQFYDDVDGVATVRYDWAAVSETPHRLTVAVQGRRLRATLSGLVDGVATPVAAVEVPDIGDDLGAGLPGLFAGDGGTVHFSGWSVAPTAAGDLAPLPAAFAPSGDCR